MTMYEGRRPKGDGVRNVEFRWRNEDQEKGSRLDRLDSTELVAGTAGESREMRSGRTKPFGCKSNVAMGLGLALPCAAYGWSARIGSAGRIKEGGPWATIAHATQRGERLTHVDHPCQHMERVQEFGSLGVSSS